MPVSIRIISDLIPGEMESTLLRSFLKAAKLKRWLAKPDCPPVMKECKVLFDKIYLPKVSDSDVSGTAGEDTIEPVSAPPDLRAFLNGPKQVVMPARVRHNGIMYSTAKTHQGNSLVQFYPHGDRTLSPIPASIKHIYCDKKTYLAVQRQLPAGNTVVDPFALYPYFPAKLYSSQLSPTLELVQLDWIFSHYARWNFSRDHSVVLSLNRVCVFANLPSKESQS
jgi:hypothetical protein